jgi:glucokinase
VEVLPCAGHASLGAAVKAYLAGPAAQAVAAGRVAHAAIAIANPVEGDVVAMTNHHWSFSIAALKYELGLETLAVVNDFTALAMALPHLGPQQWMQVGGGQPRAGSAIGLVGPGTGLGVGGLVPVDGRWVALASEGGHASFAPGDDLEDELMLALRREYGHVSAERLLSGAGLELIYRVLSKSEPLPAAEITRRALDGSCVECVRVVECFFAVLGSVAGNVALTLGATGGMYIGGGIVPRLVTLVAQSQFRARFEAKGRLSDYVARIPTYLITEPYPAFFGVSAILSERMAA